MRRNCRTAPDEVRIQAEATAASIIAQGREAALDSQPRGRLAALEPQSRGRPAAIAEPEDEPMNRYINPIPPPCRPPACPTADQGTQDRILETLCCQNQLLLDLLSAVNALTVAMLNRRGPMDGGGCANA